MTTDLENRESMHGTTTGMTAPPQANGSSNGHRGDVVAFIGPGVVFKGTISYKGSVQIDGRLEGEIHTDGVLLVGQQAVVTAKVSAGSVISKGTITGDIVAKECVQLLASAVMDGSLKTPQLSMETGVLLNGTVEMKPESGRLLS
ncbi:MAG: polymer-forming cytoskeletal protein [Nitrospirae bacterium]|nr:MAG: polymer-forming cytoskeletal protein [Nitrospirota bacterium]